MSEVAAGFNSRAAAAGAMAEEFPEHNELVRVAGPSLEQLSKELLEKRAQYRQMGLEIARLECELKRKIGLFRGLRTKVGTWFWEKTTPKRKVDWISLADDLKIPDNVKAKYTKEAKTTRILRFERQKEAIWTINPKE